MHPWSCWDHRYWLLNRKKNDANTGATRRSKLTGLLHNEDCLNFFDHRTFPEGKAGEMVDRHVDVLAGAGVSALMCNTSSWRTNYRSEVWEAFWDGYDPSGPDDQPFLEAVPQKQRASDRTLPTSRDLAVDLIAHE